jgi:hypothetical protein
VQDQPGGAAGVDRKKTPSNVNEMLGRSSTVDDVKVAATGPATLSGSQGGKPE